MVAVVVTRRCSILTKLSIIIYVWVIANGSILTVEASCPAGYVDTYGRCLRVIQTRHRWSDAHHACRSTGGRLASVLADNDPVMTVVGQQIPGATRVWIGLHGTRTDWQYASVYGTNRFIQPQGCYLSYGTGEFIIRPGTGNHYTTPPQCMQDCRRQGRRYAGILRWNSAMASAVFPLECRCSDRFTPDLNQIVPCVWRCPTNSSFYCASDFNDQKSRSASISLLVFRLQDVYSSFDAWERGQPNSNYYGQQSPRYESCNSLNVIDSSNFGWNDENCAQATFWSGHQTLQYSHLCGYDVSHEDLCRRAGRIYTANRCFSGHTNSAMSWFMARKSCLDAGGDLLRVDDAEILGALTGYLRAGTRWWVDGVNQRWTWDDDRPLDRYINWIAGRPTIEINRCVALASEHSWKWTEDNCDSVYPYVCEADRYVAVTTTTSTSTTTTTTTTTERPTSTTPTTTYSRGQSSSVSTRGRMITPSLTLMLNTTTTNGTAAPSSVPSSGRGEYLTRGVIMSLVITMVVVLLTTARMLVSCCVDKPQRDDWFN